MDTSPENLIADVLRYYREQKKKLIEHYLGDCLNIIPTMAEASIDACVTDPPYELGFMGALWDRSGVAFRPETWAAVLRVLKPGACLVAFGAPRNYHRMAVAIEDAGFEVRDCLMWIFATGFPKSRALLKPAYEPIILARKPGPLRELNIDGCRIEGPPWKAHSATGLAAEKFFTRGEAKVIEKQPHALGRWPADVLHDGSDEVLAGFPETTATRYFYSPKANKADRAGSKHPTVKPLALMRWLCRLVTPAGGTILDPFAGTGTTLQAAREEGFEAIGIEIDSECQADIERRLTECA